MESKDKLERIENFIDGSPITKEYRGKLNADVKEIEKALEEFEELKKLMGTPIQEIMKRLKILERINLLVARYNDGVLGCVDFVFEVKEVLNNDK